MGSKELFNDSNAQETAQQMFKFDDKDIDNFD